MRVALFSTAPLWERKDANFDLCVSRIAEAARHKARVAVFPEMTLTGFSMNAEKTAEPQQGSPSVRRFSETAKRHKVGVIFGAVLRSGRKITNQLIVTDRKGLVRGRYAKRHLFAFAGEDRAYQKGTKAVTARVDGARFGLSICYDLRFPDVFAPMARKCDAIVNIANWPNARMDHWFALLKARAIENQTYMIGVNRTGRDGNGLVYRKSSAVFGPDGRRLEPLYQQKQTDVYELDLGSLRRYRRGFPFR